MYLEALEASYQKVTIFKKLLFSPLVAYEDNFQWSSVK